MKALAIACASWCLATTAIAQDSIISQLQAGKFACNTLEELWTLVNNRTPTGIQRLTSGCWLVEENEIRGGYPPAYAADETGSQVITFQRVRSTRSSSLVLLFLKVDMVDDVAI